MDKRALGISDADFALEKSCKSVYRVIESNITNPKLRFHRVVKHRDGNNYSFCMFTGENTRPQLIIIKHDLANKTDVLGDGMIIDCFKDFKEVIDMKLTYGEHIDQLYFTVKTRAGDKCVLGVHIHHVH